MASCLLISNTNTELSYILPSEAAKKGCFERLFQVGTGVSQAGGGRARRGRAMLGFESRASSFPGGWKHTKGALKQPDGDLWVSLLKKLVLLKGGGSLPT